MAKNQKRAAVEMRWQRLVVVIGLVVAVGGFTVGYVVQRRAHDELGQQIEGVEREIGWITERVREGRDQLERCRRKDVLVTRATAMELGLKEISASQRLVIPLLVEATTPAGNPAPNSTPAKPLPGVLASTTELIAHR